jgi:hypothetical protein
MAGLVPAISFFCTPVTSAVIARLDRATQYSRALVIGCEGAAYWIARFRGR